MANDNESNEKSKRNLIQEMSDLAARASATDPSANLQYIENLCVSNALSLFTSDQQWALGEYGVVKTIAILQTVIKELIRDVVNYKESRGEVLPEPNKAKVSLEMLRLLTNKTFSLGQFAAHTIDVNSFSDLESAFKTYCGMSLLEATKKSYKLADPKAVYDNIKSNVQALFEKRHIICHENAEVNALEEGLFRIGLYSVRILMGTFRHYREVNMNDQRSQ